MNFNQLVKYILEDNASGGGGVFGGGESFGHGGDVGNSDFWNTGDARIPFVIGTFKRSGRVKKRKKRKNAKKKKEK
jgi:hypothetical protein